MSGAAAAGRACDDGPGDAAIAVFLGLPVALAARLRAHPRAADRLGRLLRERIGTMPEDPGPAARAVLALDADGLRGLALRAGAVALAGEVLRLIDGAALRDFVAGMGGAGEAARDAALRLHALGAAFPGSGLPTQDASLAARVADAGWRCLGSWCEAQVAPVAGRVRLSLPPQARPFPPADGEGASAAAVRIVEALTVDV